MRYIEHGSEVYIATRSEYSVGNDFICIRSVVPLKPHTLASGVPDTALSRPRPTISSYTKAQ